MADALTLHVTSIALEGRAALIRGPSGRGKSALSLQLIGMGAGLISDDRTVIWRDGDLLIADAPSSIRNRIEARGVGILHAPATGPAQVALLIDMAATPPARLPEPESEEILGLPVARLRKTDAAHFPAAAYLYLRYGRAA